MNFVIAASNLPSESSCDSGKADFEGPLGPFGGQRQGFSYVKGFISEVLRIWRDSNPMLFTSRRCDEGFEDVLKWQRHQNGAKMVLKWSQNGPGMVPKCITDWSNHKTYMDLKIRMSFGSFFWFLHGFFDMLFAWNLDVSNETLSQSLASVIQTEVTISLVKTIQKSNFRR